MFALAAGLLALSGCSTGPTAAAVEGTERDAVLAYTEPMADDLFAAMNAGDYTAFSKDFDEAMIKAMDEKSFNEMNAMFQPAIGAYRSRSVQKVERVDKILVVTYAAAFEQEDAVSVRLSFREGEPPQVAGMWFDSPKLREASK